MVKRENIAYGVYNVAKAHIPRDLQIRPDLSSIPKTQQLKVVVWNVNGVRALLRKRPEQLKQLWADTDVLGLLETRIAGQGLINSVQHELELLLGKDPKFIWNSGTVRGYAGCVAIMRPNLADRLESVCLGCFDDRQDNEGRCIRLRFKNTAIVIAYVPNSGMNLRRLNHRLAEWDPTLARICATYSAECKNGVILAADMNCAHRDQDIWNVESPAILKGAGTTPEERNSFQVCYLESGLFDTFARMHPNLLGWFSYWSVRARNRSKNRGLRLDYVFTDKKVNVIDAFILHEYADSGDHCPVGIVAKIDHCDI